MQFEELVEKGKEIKKAYAVDNKNPWGMTEFTQGLVSDVGDLLKLIMAKNSFRTIENVDEKIAHELSDCLWATMMIADELGVDLEKEFVKNMEGLKERIKSKSK